MGSEYVTQRAWEKALPILRQLWENFPEFPQRSTVAVQLAQAYSATQRCTEALLVYDTLIDTTTVVGEQRLSRIAKALCLFELGRYAEVIATLSPLLGATSAIPIEPRELYLLGQAHMQLHHFPEAIEVFTLLQQRFPTDALTALAAAIPGVCSWSMLGVRVRPLQSGEPICSVPREEVKRIARSFSCTPGD